MLCRAFADSGPFRVPPFATQIVISGSIVVDGILLGAYEALDLGNGEAASPSIEAATAGAEFLFLAGEPITEPVVFGGPFVMNSQREIESAYRDYEAGLFGAVPTTSS